MIVFNGQYLSAAAIDNMRITAMSQGDKWLIGGPDWLAAEATKDAILSAFGAEGAGVIQATNAYLNAIAATDREKAQRLAEFINEDPMLVCSIVETSKTRWLTIRNNNAYGYNNGFVMNSPLKDTGSVRTKVQKVDMTGNWVFLAKWGSSAAVNPCVGADFNDIGATITTSPSPWSVTDATEITLEYDRTESNRTFWGSFINSKWSRVFRTAFVETISKADGTRMEYLIPFIRDGVAYMLNLDTFELYGNVNQNESFIIEITIE